MRKPRRGQVVALSLGLCVAARLALAMCQYAVDTSVEGTTQDCSSSCDRRMYIPSVMRCTNTCDSLSCSPGDWVQTTTYWASGTCSGGKCVNIQNGVNPGSWVQEYSSDDGCTTLCGG